MNKYEQMVEDLKDSPNETFIYGCGYSGNNLYNEMTRSGLSVDGFLLDDEYKKIDEFKGKPVYAISDFLDNLSKSCNIVIGFVNFSEEQERRLREHTSSNIYIYMFDATYFEFSGEWTMADFYNEHKSEFEKARELFCEDESKKVFERYIEQRCTMKYRKPHSSETKYFDKDILSLQENEVLIDCGAYNGDTVMSFMDALKEAGISCYEKIYAFEADSRNCGSFKSNLSQYENIELIPKAAYDKTCVLTFSENGSTASAVSEGGTLKIDAASIDEVVNGNRVTLIKMDIEGSELKALQGAEKTIRKYKPRLAICIYHKANDLLTIPQYIKSLDPSYKLYMRSYYECSCDTVLYAI